MVDSKAETGIWQTAMKQDSIFQEDVFYFSTKYKPLWGKNWPFVLAFYGAEDNGDLICC